MSQKLHNFFATFRPSRTTAEEIRCSTKFSVASAFALLLLLACPASAQIFSTYVTICDFANAAFTHCSEKFLALALIPGGGSDWEIVATIPAGSLIPAPVDSSPQSSNFRTQTNVEMRIGMRKHNSFIAYPLRTFSIVRNAVEIVEHQSYFSKDVCESLNPGSRCCSTDTPQSYTIHSLGWTGEQFDCFSVFSGSVTYDLQISVTIGDSSFRIELDETKREWSLGVLNASIIDFVASTTLPDFSSYALCSERWTFEYILVPFYAFGTTPNHIGMTSESFYAQFQCPPIAPQGYLTTVLGDDIDDQFASFRSSTPDSYFRGAMPDMDCQTHGVRGMVLNVNCSDTGTVKALIEISAEELRLVKMFAIPKVLWFGQKVSLLDHAMCESTIEIHVVNDNEAVGSLLLELLDCSAQQRVHRCDFFDTRTSLSESILQPRSVERTISPFSTRKVNFALPQDEIIVQHFVVTPEEAQELKMVCGTPDSSFRQWSLFSVTQWTCTVIISQHAVEMESFGVTVNGFAVVETAVEQLQSPPLVPFPASQFDCAADVDLVWNSTIQRCSPMTNEHCAVKYMFASPPRTFFNPDSGQCEPSTSSQCDLLLEYYDTQKNKCVSLTLNQTGTQTAQETTVEPTASRNASWSVPSDWMVPIQLNGTSEAMSCGHGSWNESVGACVCDEGFATSPNQNPFDMRWCDIVQPRVDPAMDSAPQGQGSWKMLLSPHGWKELGVALLLLLVLLLICCVCCCVCACRRCKKEREEALQSFVVEPVPRYVVVSRYSESVPTR